MLNLFHGGPLIIVMGNRWISRITVCDFLTKPQYPLQWTELSILLFIIQVSVACQMINVYDLKYSENPFECPGMLIGLGAGIGLLALLAIAGLLCYACGKYRGREVDDHYPNRGKQQFSLRMLSQYFRASRHDPALGHDRQVKQVHM